MDDEKPIVDHSHAQTKPLRGRIPCPDSQGGKNRLTSGVTSPLQGAELQNLLFSPLKLERDSGSQTICLPPRYPGKDGGRVGIYICIGI